jgi:HTH-type transcriptional regulator, transcriptional repressor of NAD biosynthesis genes
MIKVCFYGPESTGKTVLARNLAAAYQTEFVPEVARELISSNEFSVADIIHIGQEQTLRIKRMEKRANRILFCDTDLITTQIYARQYLGMVPTELIMLEREIRYDQYFLFDFDVPWVADGLRDLGNQRQKMYDIFRDELEKRRISYVPVSGNFEDREAVVRKHVDRMLSNSR